jgi:predicted  nucleic acid-binding Zn-ribbon protein
MTTNKNQLHKHKCPECGYIWEHGEECGGNEAAHTCSQCGCNVFACWVRYEGEGKAQENNGQHCQANPAQPLTAEQREQQYQLRRRAAHALVERLLGD